MKLIPLTKGLFTQVDDADYDWLNQWKWHAHKIGNAFYARRRQYVGEGRYINIKMHRQILGLTDPKIKGEHWDRNRLNNQRENLRKATQQQNVCNTASTKGTSKFKGVSWSNQMNKWRASIKFSKKSFHLGFYESEEEAARAYNGGAKLHHKEFAVFNDVSPLFLAKPVPKPVPRIWGISKRSTLTTSTN